MLMKSRELRRRTASVLILTLVVIALLTLGASAFFERMFAEHRATRAHGRQLQARQFAESGVDYARFLLTQDPYVLYQSGGLFANPTLFQGILVNDDPAAAFRGRFTVLAPNLTTDGYYGGVRYGLENESSRLNLNTVLLADNSGEDAARKLLMTLPGMSEQIADTILDWVDADDQPRMLGAEREYYSSLDPPYVPRNGPLHSIEELLLVRDVTPALLFGADLNRNLLVDASEQPLTVMDYVDNSAGLLNRGWAAYLTLDGAERNTRPDGQPKIDVNMEDLKELHSQLAAVLSPEMANFIVAYRQGGPTEDDDSPQPASGISLNFETQGRERLTTVLDLIGTRTSFVPQGQNEEKVVEAAFPDDPGAMASYLPKLMENVTVNPSPTIPGRLNINQANRRLLAGVPGLDANMIEQIIANRDVQLTPERPEQAYETWLLTQGIVDLEQMKGLMPFITAGGSVYRVQVVGYFDADGPASRLEVVIDASQTPPVVKRRRELDDLGGGYSLDVLGAVPDDI
jgi:type II secretory pathway component PulK